MKIERMQISINDFLKYLLKKWKMIICVTVICAAFFGACMKLLCDVTIVPASEEYLIYEKKAETFQEYIDNSIIMKMDPTNIHQRTLMIQKITNYSLLEDYVLTGDVWGTLKNEIPVQYLNELVVWEDGHTPENAKIILRYNTEDGCAEYAEFLKNQLLAYDENLNIVVGGKTIIADIAILAVQEENHTLLKGLNNTMKSANAGYRETISLTSAVVFGTLVGVIISIVIVFSQYVFTKKIRNVEELEIYSKAKVIGKKGKDFQDVFAPEITSSAFKVVISEQLKPFEELVLINMIGDKMLIDGLVEVSGELFMQDRDMFEKVILADGVIIAAAVNKTNYKALEDIVFFLEKNEKKICGCIVC